MARETCQAVVIYDKRDGWVLFLSYESGEVSFFTLGPKAVDLTSARRIAREHCDQNDLHIEGYIKEAPFDPMEADMETLQSYAALGDAFAIACTYAGFRIEAERSYKEIGPEMALKWYSDMTTFNAPRTLRELATCDVFRSSIAEDFGIGPADLERYMKISLMHVRETTHFLVFFSAEVSVRGYAHRERDRSPAAALWGARKKDDRKACPFERQFESGDPEFHDSDLSKMTMVDLFEMLAGWVAEAHVSRSDVMKKVIDKCDRYSVSQELKSILMNTVDRFLEVHERMENAINRKPV